MSGWDRLPVDGSGYIDPAQLADLNDDELRTWTANFEAMRYDTQGWRNVDNLWRETLGLDTTTGKTILDFGCGFGIEALQFARAGNELYLFDLTRAGLNAAQRVLRVHGYDCRTTTQINRLPRVDIFYANGVLHHTPDAPRILSRAKAEEARLMVYSDKAWEWSQGRGKPFWRLMDEVGGYADWYSPEKLQDIAPDWELVKADYISQYGHYLTATLRRK